jgi:hypothetical protein
MPPPEFAGAPHGEFSGPPPIPGAHGHGVPPGAPMPSRRPMSPCVYAAPGMAPAEMRRAARHRAMLGGGADAARASIAAAVVDMMPPMQHDGGGFRRMPPPSSKAFEPNPIVSALSPAARGGRAASAATTAPARGWPPRAAPKPRTRACASFSGLPPAMAESLALAGVPWPPQPEPASEGRQLEDEVAGAPPAKKPRGLAVPNLRLGATTRRVARRRP